MRPTPSNMQFDPQKHHRHSIRLKGYDYAQPGAYFITLCTYQKQCWFGDIRNGQMYLNQIGKIVVREWLRSSEIRSEISFDEWFVMPNHLHGIMVITDDDAERAHSRAPLQEISNFQRKPVSLSSFVAQFKATVTRRINNVCSISGVPIWQRNYYESILRDEDSLNMVRQYIIDNPRCWNDDPENPKTSSNYQPLYLDVPF